MSKSTELKTTTDLVKKILQDVPEARNSDDFLYYKVCEKINALYINLPFWKVIVNRKLYGFPAFESVRRTRQKVQAEYPELSGNSTVEGNRMLNEKVFRDYARKGTWL